MCYNITSIVYFGLLPLMHVEYLSSQTSDQTRTPLIGRRSCNHWATREVLLFNF